MTDDADRPKWEWPWPQSWRQVFGLLVVFLLGFLAVAYALDFLKQALGHWDALWAQVAVGNATEAA